LVLVVLVPPQHDSLVNLDRASLLKQRGGPGSGSRRDRFEASDVLEQCQLADLANVLSASSFVNFFLGGLDYQNELSAEDFRTLYSLSDGHGIAIYNLTRLLSTQGGANQAVLRRLCANYGQIQQIEQFRARLEEGVVPGNEAKMNRVYHDDLAVSAESLMRFKAKFADVA
jgi:hypothetical protein